MIHIEDIFKLLIHVTRGIDYVSGQTLGDYFRSILIKTLGFLSLTLIYFVLFALLSYLIDLWINSSLFVYVIRYVGFIFILASIPSLIDTQRIHHIQKDNIYMQATMILWMIVILCFLLLHFLGADVLMHLIF
ncbi:MAG: hypothetical protein WC992_00840 [Acholeplasmataceae bacterium]|jgi:hypothetical protein|nr:hypothetical protein [Acholeplasmataceae bacterium]